MGEADTNGDQHIDFGEFLTVVERTKAGDSSVKGLGDAIRKKSSVMLQIKKDATVHSFAEEVRMALEPLTLTLTTDPDANPSPNRTLTLTLTLALTQECMAFADFINTKLGADPQL